MFSPWKYRIAIGSSCVTMLVTDPTQGDLLKARLPSQANHPRALLTLLEGLALWNGQPACAVLRAKECCRERFPCLLGDELWPGESQLVRMTVADDGVRKRLSGLGDYRSLRTLCGGER